MLGSRIARRGASGEGRRPVTIASCGRGSPWEIITVARFALSFPRRYETIPRTVARSFTVGIAQIDPRLGDVDANLAIYEQSLREAKGRGVDLLVFPELSLTGYFLKDMVST